MSKRKHTPTDDELPFNDLLEQIESSVKAIEDEDVGIEVALQEFEKGITLVKQAQTRLNQAEQTVRQLLETDGELVEKEVPLHTNPE